MVILSENELLEAVGNLLLKSISGWEDRHLYAMTYSAEYKTFWGLLDENLKAAVSRCRTQNREDRVFPYSMSLLEYFKVIMTTESYEKLGGLYWKRQLKFILADRKFRAVTAKLNLELRGSHRNDYRKLEHQTPTYTGTQQFATRIG